MKCFDWIASHANRTPAKLAQVDWASQRRFSYAQMHQRVSAVAGYLQGQLAVKQGDRVAVLAVNCSDLFELQFACVRLGAVFVPLNVRLAPAELEYMLNDLDAKLLFCAPAFLETGNYLQEVCKLEHLKTFSGDGSECDYEAGISNAEPVTHMAAVEDSDNWAILYTSGTTGRPKGACLTHRMVLYNALNLAAPAALTRDSVNLCMLPIFHTSGLNVYANPVFYLGATNVVMGNFDPGLALQLMGDVELGITHLIAVPAIYQFMAADAAFETTDFSGITVASVGGAPAPESILKRCAAGGLLLSQGYGMTETGPSALAMDEEDSERKLGSCGKPVLHIEAKLVCPDGALVARGEVGELWLRGPSITPGYWRRPEANAKEFTDGWLHTGDAAYCDEDGYYYIVARWKDMYISGGENVYPAEVENIISELPELLEAAVIGIDDEKWGEVGCAFLVLHAGQAIDRETVLSHCQSKLAKYKVPKEIRFIDTLPRNATGKVLKAELQAMVPAK